VELSLPALFLFTRLKKLGILKMSIILDISTYGIFAHFPRFCRDLKVLIWVSAIRWILYATLRESALTTAYTIFITRFNNGLEPGFVEAHAQQAVNKSWTIVEHKYEQFLSLFHQITQYVCVNYIIAAALSIHILTTQKVVSQICSMKILSHLNKSDFMKWAIQIQN